MKVKLSGYEMLLAAHAGVMRQVEAIRRGRVDNHGFRGDGWGAHIEGCGAEMAVAKSVGIYWEAVTTNPDHLEGDVGAIEVRSSEKPDGRLILHPTDPDDSLFIFVVGKLPEYEIKGGIVAAEGKKQPYWQDPGTGRPAFFVPQEALRPLSAFNLGPAPVEAVA